MKLLMIVHQFLPRHLAGSELYTYHLARELRRRGHSVHLFFTEIRTDRLQYEVRRGVFDGLPFHEAVHNRQFPSFEHGYRDREMERIFRSVLDAVRPDLVHIQHLQFHSIGYVDIAKDLGLPLVYTLHEYVLLCLREGLLLRPDGELCPGPEARACAHCATAAPHRPKPIQLTPTGERFARVVGRSATLHGLARRLWRAMHVPSPTDNGYVAAVEERQQEVRARLDRVDLFLAPSRFLAQRFIASRMISPDRIVHSPYGLAFEPDDPRPRSSSTRLRVGFIGTISRHKGVHLILEAFREIADPGIECRIHGDRAVFPDYTRALDEMTTPQVRFMGRLERSAVGAALAELDLLIVPSIWYENAPLTIQEAFRAGVPVLASDQGGMAELVRDGENGLLFRLGNATHLREQILRCRRDLELLPRLRGGLPRVRTIGDDAERMEERYRALLRDARRGAEAAVGTCASSTS